MLRNSYKSENEAQWHTKEFLIYRLINQILRTENLESFFLFEFYIIDLSTQLHHLHKQQTNEFGTLYRGQTILKGEFRKI